jgi:hypothetical protein
MERLEEKREAEVAPGDPAFTDPGTVWIPNLGAPKDEEATGPPRAESAPPREESAGDHLEAEAEDWAREVGRVGEYWGAAVGRMAPRAAAAILERAQRGDSGYALPAAVIFLALALEWAGESLAEGSCRAGAWRNV